MSGGRVQRILVQPINLIFKFLQNVRESELHLFLTAPWPSLITLSLLIPAENKSSSLAFRTTTYETGGTNYCKCVGDMYPKLDWPRLTSVHLFAVVRDLMSSWILFWTMWKKCQPKAKKNIELQLVRRSLWMFYQCVKSITYGSVLTRHGKVVYCWRETTSPCCWLHRYPTPQLAEDDLYHHPLRYIINLQGFMIQNLCCTIFLLYL